MAQTRQTFWAPVCLNNRITIPEVLCQVAGINDKKIVKITIEQIRDKAEVQS